MKATVTLTPEEIAFFDENGYLGPFDIEDPELVAKARKLVDTDLAERESPIYGDKTGRDWHLASRPIYELCSHPAIVERLAGVLGPDILLWRSQMFYKKPGDGETAWHQDSNFPGPFKVASIDPSITVTAWIALDETSVENGCVELVAGSHKEGKIATVKGEAGEGIFGRNYKLGRDVGGDDTIAKMIIKPGQFFIFSNLTVHGSGPNNSNTTRLGIGTRFTSTDVRVYPGLSIDGQGMSLENFGCILVRGENRYDHNRMTSPPNENVEQATKPAASPHDTGFKTGYRLGYAKGERHADKGIRIEIEKHEAFANATLGYTKGHGDPVAYSKGFKEGVVAGYADGVESRPFDTRYGSPADAGAPGKGRRRGPLFKILRGLKKLVKKF